VPPGKSKYCNPTQIDDVARDFPELKIVAFHMGYPYTDQLNMVAMGHPNVTLCLSLLVPWALTAPYKFAHILGEAIRFVGPDRIVWGTDSAGYGAQIGAAALGLADFQMPEELQWKYGYLPLTDEEKQKIFGGNLGKLLGIDTTKRRGGANAVHDSLNSNVKPVVLNTAKNAKKEEPVMADNTYEIVVCSPMGDIDGKAVLNIDGTALSGTLSLMGKDNVFSNGGIDADGNVSFKGELSTPIGKMAYTATGTVKDGNVDVSAKTKMGDFAIKSK
jgi:hypothetical protein